MSFSTHVDGLGWIGLCVTFSEEIGGQAGQRCLQFRFHQFGRFRCVHRLSFWGLFFGIFIKYFDRLVVHIRKLKSSIYLLNTHFNWLFRKENWKMCISGRKRGWRVEGLKIWRANGEVCFQIVFFFTFCEYSLCKLCELKFVNV